MQIDLTIIIPNYNCLSYLKRCLDSVTSQLPANGKTEILVIDDGSDDGSKEWLKAKQAICKPLTVHFQQNEGVVAARNKAIGLAKGTWIAFLDADDFWYSGKLDAQLSAMKANPQCTMSFTNYDHLTEAYESIVDCFSYWQSARLNKDNSPGFHYLKDPVNTLLATNVVGTSSVMVRRTAFAKVGVFDRSLKSASDWDMWLRLASAGDVAYSSTPMMGYLMRAGSITSNRRNRLNAMQSIIDKTKMRTKVKPWAVRMAEANVLEGLADFHRQQRAFERAVLNDFQSLFKSPNLRNFKHLCFDMWKWAQA